MRDDEGGSDRRLWLAIIDHLLSGRMNPAQMKIACFCLRRGYVAPRFMSFEEWIALADRFEISGTWLRQSVRELWNLGLLCRDQAGRRPGYALNPDWIAPPPETVK